MVDALKRASAGSIVAVIPYFGYARQDRKVKPRTPISAKLVTDLITAAGVDRVVSVDLHAGQIQGFFNIPVDHLYAMPVYIEFLRSRGLHGENTVVVSPDAGGVERARAFAKRLESMMAIIDKRRPAPNISEVMNVIGDVRGKHAVIIDDLIDTAGTATAAAKVVLDQGAKSVICCATHGVLSGPAIDRISGSVISEVVISDSIPLSPAAQACGKIKPVGGPPVWGSGEAHPPRRLDLEPVHLVRPSLPLCVAPPRRLAVLSARCALLLLAYRALKPPQKTQITLTAEALAGEKDFQRRHGRPPSDAERQAQSRELSR